MNAWPAEIGRLRACPALSDLPERPDMVWIGVTVGDVQPVRGEATRLGDGRQALET